VTHQLVMPLEGFAAAVSARGKRAEELAAMEQRRRRLPLRRSPKTQSCKLSRSGPHAGPAMKNLSPRWRTGRPHLLRLVSDEVSSSCS
jgi:hypothetical protein